jgi:hypothetical protein
MRKECNNRSHQAANTHETKKKNTANKTTNLFSIFNALIELLVASSTFQLFVGLQKGIDRRQLLKEQRQIGNQIL